MIWIILIVAILIAGIGSFLSVTYEQEERNKRYSEAQQRKKQTFSNYKIKKVFTQNELNFFFLLKQYLKDKDNTILLTKVRIADFVKNDNFRDFTKISQKHIDYIISDNKGNIKLLIELDGYSHNYKKTIISDNFKNELFKDLNIPLIRYKNNTNYDFKRIESFI